MNETTQPAVAGPVEPTVRPPTFPVRLVCWHCGEGRDVLTHGPAQFAFEVAGWADEAGMKGFFDMERGRVLVFCNGDHARQQMTKDGRFRLRPKRAA
jgi:hypothetical protein